MTDERAFNKSASTKGQRKDESTPLLPDASTQNSQPNVGKGQFLAIFMSLMIGAFLTALDSTIVITLLTRIGSEFEQFNAVSWLGTAYLIGSCVVQPLSGKLSDIYGRRPCIIVANIAFGLGCLGCGLSRSFKVLVCCRFLAGLGGGAMNTLSVVTVSDYVSLRQRGLYQGIANIVWGVGSSLGGVFGGLMDGAFGWRMAFISQVPIIALATLSVAMFVKTKPKASNKDSKLKRVDFLGSLSLMAAVGLLMFSLSTGGNEFSWKSPIIIASLVLSPIAFVIFWWVEQNYAAEPIVPMKVLRNRTVFAANMGGWFSAMGGMALTFYVPIFFSIVKEYTASEVGVQLTARAAALSLGSVSAGIFMLKGKYYWLSLAFCVVQIAGAIAHVFMAPETPDWSYYMIIAIPALGLGGVLVTLMMATVASVGLEHQAVAISIAYAFRSTGSTIGVALATAVFQTTLWHALSSHLSGETAAEVIEEVRSSADAINKLPASIKALVLQSYLDSLRAVYVTVSGLYVLSAIFSAFMEERKLHKTLDRS